MSVCRVCVCVYGDVSVCSCAPMQECPVCHVCVCVYGAVWVYSRTNSRHRPMRSTWPSFSSSYARDLIDHRLVHTFVGSVEMIARVLRNQWKKWTDKCQYLVTGRQTLKDVRGSRVSTQWRNNPSHHTDCQPDRPFSVMCNPHRGGLCPQLLNVEARKDTREGEMNMRVEGAWAWDHFQSCAM